MKGIELKINTDFHLTLKKKKRQFEKHKIQNLGYSNKISTVEKNVPCNAHLPSSKWIHSQSIDARYAVSNIMQIARATSTNLALPHPIIASSAEASKQQSPHEEILPTLKKKNH